MIRKFRINNAVKGDILRRCSTCDYTFIKESRYVHLVVFDDSKSENKFLLQCILHQRSGDPYKDYWKSREVTFD